MALSRVTTWIAGQTLTASALNAEFDNILNNAASLFSPLTATLDLDGNTLVIDSDADSTLRATADDVVALRLLGFDAFIFDGDVASPVNGLTLASAATGSGPTITAQGSDTNIPVTVAGKGTGAVLLGQATSTDVRLVADQPIADSSGNELIKFTKAASAVNEITVANAATGAEPSISATGGDTDIDLKLTPKGAGVVNVTAGGLTITAGGITVTAGGLSITAGALNQAQGADIASAATLNLDTATGNLVDVTGTTTITAITLSQGRERVARFTGALTLTHGASLVLPGAANITTAAGDFAIFRGYAAGVVRCVAYTRADGTPLVSSAAASQSDQETATSTTTYVSPGRQHFHPSAAKAWVNFNGTGTVAINTSYNTTSITDEGTGDYTWTIATDFSSANWCMVGSCWITATNTGVLCRKSAVALAAGSARVTTFSIGAAALADADEVYLAGFGDI